MTATTILALLFFLILQAAAQDVPRPQAQARCNFSDGAKLTVTYSPARGKYRLTTDENLVTVKGIRVPSGDYIVFPAKGPDNKWTLSMRNEKGQSSLPPLPLSATASTFPVGNLTVSFDHTGGSCVMHWGAEKSNVLLSLEFTETNTDLPVLK